MFPRLVSVICNVLPTLVKYRGFGGAFVRARFSICLGKRTATVSARENRMASLQETIDFLYIAHDEKVLSDEEFLMLFDELVMNSVCKHSNFPYFEYEPFNWENYDPLTCKIELRFEKDDIPHLQKRAADP